MRAFLFVAIATALMHSLIIQLEPAAPLRGQTRQELDRVAGSADLAAASRQIGAAAGGRNVAMQMIGNARPLRAAGIYFQACYDLYPRRVFVGPADKVVNGWNDLTGPLPDAATLRRLDVDRVVTVNP